jgi:hypothetical protein
VLAGFRENRPVSPLDRHFALAKFDELKHDPEWVAQLNRSSLAAKKQLALIQSI